MPLNYTYVPSLHEVDGWVSVEKCAKTLDVDVSTVRHLVSSGRLVARRWGGHTLMISSESIDRHQGVRHRPGRPLKLLKSGDDNTSA